MTGTRAELLNLYSRLRVADVADGMDWTGSRDTGSLGPEIRALNPSAGHCISGIVRTVRYVPHPEGQETDWRKVWPVNWLKEGVTEGDVFLIDQSGINAGILGSENTLVGIKQGARGYITNGGIRDTDELRLQRVPVWSAHVAQRRGAGRVIFDGLDVPIRISGQEIHPGDLVVADGDGVTVVPRAKAEEVGRTAWREREKDMGRRAKHYEELGREPDATLQIQQEP